jgi:lipid-A-disaccharide synthase
MAFDEFDSVYGLEKSRSVITLLPGSREHEVTHILPVMLSAAGEIARRIPGTQFLIARSPNLPRQLIEDILKKAQEEGTSATLLHLAQQAGDLLKQASTVLKPQANERVSSLATPEGLLISPEDHTRESIDWAKKRMSKPSQTAPLAIVDDATHDAMARADLVIAASGTATLEAAILGRPPIIVYRGSSLMNLEYIIRRKALNLTYIGLPNILAQRSICPEFVQDGATPGAIADKAVEMILQPERLIQLKNELSAVIIKNLGEAGATRRTAQKLINYMNAEKGIGKDLPSGAND